MISHHYFASIWQDAISHQQSLWSNQAFSPGDALVDFSHGEILQHATCSTIQLSENEHITLKPSFLQYINHSCNPNVFFDTTIMKLVCIRPIPKNDELTFFYPSTEWQMSHPFDCHCSAYNCLGYISGAANIQKDILANYKLTDFIAGKLRTKKETPQMLVSQVA